MLGAGAFMVALGAAGYQLQGWLFAIAGPLVFATVLLPLNRLVLFKCPEWLSIIFALQLTKWLLAASVLAGMIAFRIGMAP